ncbi:MAG: hypothetical protein LBK91_04540, partial [Synergistaceae bacterium]|nr:hypothetical protein [Synergistaceae bacterium]
MKEWFERNREKAVYALAAAVLLLIAGIFAQRYVSSREIALERETNAALETRLHDAAMETGAAKTEITELTRANSNLSDRVASMDSDIKTALDKIENLGRENEALKSRDEAQKASRTELESRAEALNRTNEELRSRLDALSGDNSELAQRIESLE